MTTRAWRLYPEANGSAHADVVFGDEVTVPDAPGLSFQLTRLTGGLSDGVHLLTLTAGDVQVTLLPTRGMGVWDMRCGGVRVGWQSPTAGPVHPAFVNLDEPSGLGWLDGFDELLVRCGLQSNGAPEFASDGRLVYPVHGRIANLPARSVIVEFDPASRTLSATGVVEECRLHFAKLRLTTRLSIVLGENAFSLHDRIQNLSEAPAEAQMLYHINVGPPLLGEGSRLLAPIKQLAPRDETSAGGFATWSKMPPPGASLEEQAFYAELWPDERHESHAVLVDPREERGVKLSYDSVSLPCFTYWKNLRSVSDGYVVGLEPGSNFPNNSSFEKQQGRSYRLAPGGSVECRLRLAYLGNPADVRSATHAVAATQANRPPEIRSQPQDGWSP
ncbi:MAG: aldose 1-epimerase family protein [Planctomycetota bacterium]